jgi:hypothetical protein
MSQPLICANHLDVFCDQIERILRFSSKYSSLLLRFRVAAVPVSDTATQQGGYYCVVCAV